MTDTHSFGYGQLGPDDVSSDFNVITFIMRQQLAKMDTMKPVQVKAVHGGGGAIAAAGTVDVLPLVSQIDGLGNSTPHANVNGIPWSRVQGGKNAVICDPMVGDIGYVIASDRDISALKAKKAAATPGSFRRFNIADGIYVGAFLNVAPDQYLVFTATGVRLADKNGNSLEMAAGVVTITTTLLKVNGELRVTGNVTAGEGTADMVTLQLHKHGGVQPGGGTTAPPTAGF